MSNDVKNGSGWGLSWSGFHTTMDLLGMVPVVGEAFDIANGVVYAARGDKANAAISFAGAMAPIGGQAITGARLALKGADAARAVVRQSDEAIAAVRNTTRSAAESRYTPATAGAKADDGLAATTAKPSAANSESVDLELKYKDGWTDAQRMEADVKCQALCEADTVVTQAKRSTTSASSRYKRAGNEVPAGKDVDHTHELQLGGSDTIENMLPLDSSVNRSIGSQIRHQIKGLPVGTPIGNISIY